MTNDDLLAKVQLFVKIFGFDKLRSIATCEPHLCKRKNAGLCVFNKNRRINGYMNENKHLILLNIGLGSDSEINFNPKRKLLNPDQHDFSICIEFLDTDDIIKE
jgi:hypothetical protein